MATITGITKKTENPFVNLYELDRKSKTGKEGKYYVATRATSEKDSKLVTGKNVPDGVVIYSLYGEQQDQLVFIRQDLSAFNDFIYDFPAVLVEKR